MTTFITSDNLYQRQISLIGKESQNKIQNSKVLVIGAGGLGCPALQYLASAGIGKIGVVDFDRVSLSNLQRQILFQVDDIGKRKVDIVKERLSRLAPYCLIHTFPEGLTAQNAEKLINDYEIVLDCTDNFSTKFLIHDTCVLLKKKLIQASVYQYEGQLFTFDFGKTSGPCLRCLWPIQPLDGCTGTCAEVGVIGPLLGVMGSLQAMEVIKVIIEKDHLKNGENLFVDLLTYGQEIRKFRQVSDCPCCVKKEFMKNEVTQIDLPSNLNEFIIIDVRNQHEIDVCHFRKQLSSEQTILHVPLDEIDKLQFLENKKYLAICTKGIRSLRACKALKEKHSQIFSLIGGVEAHQQLMEEK